MNLELFSPEDIAVLNRLDLSRLPQHIAVIMDGNGRWAERQGLPRVIGHHAGVESVRFMINACHDLGIPYLTLYSFSTENWRRPEEEIQALMDLIEEQLRSELEGMHRKGVRVRHLGRRDGLPASLLRVLDDSAANTRENTNLTLCFAINYSGRSELLDAATRMAQAVQRGELDPASVTEDDLAHCLYLPEVPDPDLLIRTAGEMRVSNFLLWQIAYAELWCTTALWPEFRAPHLLAALEEYHRRNRKYGGIAS